MNKYLDDAQYIAHDIAARTEGIAHLMYYYDKHSSGDRDRDAMIGVALILEDLAKKGRELSEMLDSVNRNKISQEAV